jgi:hypothetical protein
MLLEDFLRPIASEEPPPAIDDRLSPSTLIIDLRCLDASAVKPSWPLAAPGAGEGDRLGLRAAPREATDRTLCRLGLLTAESPSASSTKV